MENYHNMPQMFYDLAKDNYVKILYIKQLQKYLPNHKFFLHTFVNSNFIIFNGRNLHVSNNITFNKIHYRTAGTEYTSVKHLVSCKTH